LLPAVSSFPLSLSVQESNENGFKAQRVEGKITPYSRVQSSKPHLKKGRRQRAEGRRKENPDLSFCLLPPALCLKLTELWLAQVKPAVINS
jgi:hypothetical protein